MSSVEHAAREYIIWFNNQVPDPTLDFAKVIGRHARGMQKIAKRHGVEMADLEKYLNQHPEVYNSLSTE